MKKDIQKRELWLGLAFVLTLAGAYIQPILILPIFIVIFVFVEAVWKR